MNGLPGADSPEAELVQLAEQALLGAMLWDPRRLPEVAWLAPDDFARPAHQAIYATLVGLARDRRPIDILELPAILARGEYHDLHSGPDSGPISAVVVADLLAATPASPPIDGVPGLAPPAPGLANSGRSEHHRYAQLVLEASIRRQVTEMGARIDQAAGPPAPVSTAHIDTAAVAEALGRSVDQAATRLAALTDQLTRSAGPTSGPPASLALAGGPIPATPRQVPGLARYRDPARAEHALIGACLQSPGLRQLATSRLDPDDLATPASAATWASLAAMTAAGEPVDHVLLAAHSLRAGAHLAPGAAIRPAQLAALARRAEITSGNAALAAVTHTALLRAADRTQRLLTTIAADPTLSSEQLLRTARDVLDRLDTSLRRIDGRTPSHTGTQPAPRVPAPPPRRPTLEPCLPTRQSPPASGIRRTR
jgi:replicative DNA helicase